MLLKCHTAESKVSLIESDLPWFFFNKTQISLAHVVELECEKSLFMACELLAFGRVLWADPILQIVVPAHRIL